MNTRNSRRMLVTVLLSGATFGIAGGAALAADVETVYGRGSEQEAIGASMSTSPLADVNSAGSRASESAPANSEPYYDLRFTLMRGVRTDEKPLVDALPGRATAPADEDATWKVTKPDAGMSESSRG